MIICFLASYRELKVWKNSSCVLSLPMINWISSIRRISLFLYFSRNSVVDILFLFRIASISSLVNFSLVTYKTLACGLFLRIKWPMECIRWVLPRPTPPYIKSGLYISPGDSATAKEAACARLLLAPTTKLSNVYRGFKLAFCITCLFTSSARLISWLLSASSCRAPTCSSVTNSNSHSIPVSSSIVIWSRNPYFLLIYPRKWMSGTRIWRVFPLTSYGSVGSSHVLNETSVSSCSSFMCSRIWSHFSLIFSNIVSLLSVIKKQNCKFAQSNTYSTLL